MLTISTQAAIALLQDIYSEGCLHSANFSLTKEEFDNLLQRLEAANLIRSLQEGAIPPKATGNALSGYELCKPLHELTLLEVLQALDEPINCNQPTSEEFYLCHGVSAQEIGVVNHMARAFLSKIRISDW